MKLYPPKIKRISFGIILMLAAISLISFSIENKSKLKSGIDKKNEIPVNFHVMQITRQKLIAYCEPPSSLANVKTFFIQFTAVQNAGMTDVEYILKLYNYKTGIDPINDPNFIIEFNPVVTVPIQTPFTLPNLELRRQELITFYNSIRNTSYTYIKLEPFLLNGNVKVVATAMTTVGLIDVPIEISISKNRKRIARVYFNPCPPDRPA